jgi:death-on-curing protein
MNSRKSDPVRYLTPGELYAINESIMDGDTLVRDVHLLKSAAARPAIALFGEAQFPTILDKAASLLHSLAYHHLFIDGNKRTAVAAVERFLSLNGYYVRWSRDSQYDFVLEVAQGKHDVATIAKWLSQFVEPAARF